MQPFQGCDPSSNLGGGVGQFRPKKEQGIYSNYAFISYARKNRYLQ